MFFCDQIFFINWMTQSKHGTTHILYNTDKKTNKTPPKWTKKKKTVNNGKKN